MSTISLAPSLRSLLDQEAPMQCRFCHCNERTPCQIPVTADEDGSVRLARPDDEVAEVRKFAAFAMLTGIDEAMKSMANSPTQKAMPMKGKT